MVTQFSELINGGGLSNRCDKWWWLEIVVPPERDKIDFVEGRPMIRADRGRGAGHFDELRSQLPFRVTIYCALAR